MRKAATITTSSRASSSSSPAGSRRGPAREVKVFVDTAPVMEKPLAAAAGLGWQGKHTNLVSREFGSWLFLGAIFTSAEIAARRAGGGPLRQPAAAASTSARRDAFPAPYQLDARRCIAYLTIEHKGQIPREFRGAMGNRIFGCDDCLAVCPWNKFAEAAREAKLAARPRRDNPPLAELLALDDARLPRAFRRHADQAHGPRPLPAQRADRRRQLGRSGPLARSRRCWRCSPLVRAMAVWAVRQLTRDDVGERVRHRHLAREGDSAVRAEWQARTP